MFEGVAKFFKKLVKSEQQETKSKDTAKERLHLVLMQDRANVSADFLELMKQEIIDVIKKYIEVDDNAIDVRLTNKVEEDGTNGSPFLYANIPIVKIKNELKAEVEKEEKSSGDNNKENEEAVVTDKDKEDKDKTEEKPETDEKNDDVDNNNEEKIENKEEEKEEEKEKSEETKEEKKEEEEDKKEEDTNKNE